MSDNFDEEQLRDGLVQLRFTDDDGQLRDLNAYEMAEVIQGLAELTGRMARAGAFGDGVPPELRIRPPREGSFVIEAIVTWVAVNPEGAIATAATAGGIVTQGINTGIKMFRGDYPTDFEYLDNGNVKVKWRGGQVDEMPKEAWKSLKAMSRPTRKSFRKLMAPMSEDASALQIRSGEVDEPTDDVLKHEPEAVATKDDYRIAAAEPDDTDVENETFILEAQFINVDFRSGDKWRVATTLGTRQATIEDEDFLRSLDAGMSLHKNDIFEVTLDETRTTKNGRTTREWALTKVVRKRRGGEDDDDSPSSETPPELP